MDFAKAYFGKSLNDLVYQDIFNYFIEAKQETETIEFKSYPSGQTFDSCFPGIIRGLSAFLNSSGGILIWGAPKGVKQQGKSEKLFVGDLTPLSEFHEKDTLINKISSAMTPMPIGINVMPIISSGAFIYIFEVQPSIYKPHQYDTRYYVRLDGQTKPAPHYLIDALMKQITYPNINGFIKFHSMGLEGHLSYSLPITVVLFNFSELQNDESVSFNIVCTGGYFLRAQHGTSTPRFHYNMNGHQLIVENFAKVLHYGTPNIFEDKLIVTTDTLKANQGKLRLLLSFGGKKSPAKLSSYTLDFTKTVRLDYPNELLIETEENVMYSELKQRSSNPYETAMRFLGR